MAILDRKKLIKQKGKTQKLRPVELPTGGSVLFRVPSGKDWRDWKKHLRNEKGEIIESRAELGDELLVASILMNPDGTTMFTREEVLTGAMDELDQLDLEFMKENAYQFYGQRPGFKMLLDEDVEKNSSATQPSE